jgi:hypothetical protein
MIQYVLVARGDNVLVEHQAQEVQMWNHTTVARIVLKQIPQDAHRHVVS